MIVIAGTSQHDKIVKKLVSEGADANIVGAKAFTVCTQPRPHSIPNSKPQH